ncbi:MAG: hydrogenase accessory protein HypB [Candidatus Methanomethylicota archaeon]|jgi:hydrogenase nickel incorporation protein HypB|uniref:Hydrogenase accessory protein HypB n=1 Tax=Thermoproteota archaeon TaxID=2056631 RepID=A0A520KI80_9CREN|nr:MAG: hydrogenase accessory protein HypB [Candidatus Verstraetearchaeota archaeon]TDA40348.1 MAG: hydrogenase accessory protein HypB [Candidatus Verstraetearchaeota archaeon]
MKVKVIKSSEGEALDIELEEDFLKANEKIANLNRKMFNRYNVKVFDIMGSIGSGKTTIIERLVEILKEKYRIGVIAGDTSTTIDAERISKYGVPSIQINTGKECHLDALMVRKAAKNLLRKNIDIIFIENVGNLICPADFPLGAHKRIVVVSVTEGEYMIKKKQDIFRVADIGVINKKDMAVYMGIDINSLVRDALEANPNIKVVVTSAKTGEGIRELINLLELKI